MATGPLYQRISDDLRRKIEAGELAENAQIPSEADLAAQWHAARQTVRQALDVLLREGLIVRRHGHGTFVRRPRRMLRDGSHRHLRSARPAGTGPMEAEAADQGFVRGQSGITVSTESAAGGIAQRLEVDDGAQLLRRDMILTIDGEPAALATSWFRAETVAGSVIEQAEKVPGGVHGELARLCGDLADAVEELWARMPAPAESSALRLVSGTPVVEMWRVIPTAEGQPVEVTRFIYDGSRYRFAYTVPID